MKEPLSNQQEEGENQMPLQFAGMPKAHAKSGLLI
jgi:hypothetical protein